MTQPLIDQSQIGTIDADSLQSYTVGTGADQITKRDASGVFNAGQVKETVYNLTGTSIDLSNGTIQYTTLSANTTFTIGSMVDGQAVTLMIDNATGYTVTWPTIVWVGGSAPSLATSGYNIIELWQVNSVVYGSYVGAV